MSGNLGAVTASLDTMMDTIRTAGSWLVVLGGVFLVLRIILWGGPRSESAKAGTEEAEDDGDPDAWEAAARRVIELRGQMAEWLTDEGYALRLFIGEAQQLQAPNLVAGLAAAEAAFEAVERLKTVNAGVIGALTDRDRDQPVDAAAVTAALEEWATIKRICSRADELASLSPIYKTGYRGALAAPAEPPTPASHRLSQE